MTNNKELQISWFGTTLHNSCEKKIWYFFQNYNKSVEKVGRVEWDNTDWVGVTYFPDDEVSNYERLWTVSVQIKQANTDWFFYGDKKLSKNCWFWRNIKKYIYYFFIFFSFSCPDHKKKMAFVSVSVEVKYEFVKYLKHLAHLSVKDFTKNLKIAGSAFTTLYNSFINESSSTQISKS